MKDIKIAIIQMKVSNDKNANIFKAEQMISEAVKDERSPELLVLPEMFNCPYQSDLFPEYAEEEGEYTYQQLARIARENQIYLLGGSIPEREGNKIYNTAYIFDREGRNIGKHRKIHLFDIDI